VQEYQKCKIIRNINYLRRLTLDQDDSNALKELVLNNVPVTIDGIVITNLKELEKITLYYGRQDDT